jgi:hypothetical protein
MPSRVARKLAFWLTTTSTATPISNSGRTSKILLSTENSVPSRASRR